MWFPHRGGVVALLFSGIEIIKEILTPTISAEQWANKELQQKDRMSGMSEKEIIRNAERGRYYIPKEITDAYPIPHRDASNKIFIENSELYYDDVSRFGAIEARKWLRQGKYNLNAEELELERLRLKKKYANLSGEKINSEEIDRILTEKKWDCRKTEAVKQWQRAHDAESKYR